MTRNLIVLVATAALAGCAVFSAPDAPRYVQLQITGSDADIEQVETRPHTVLVSLPRAMPGYVTTQFAYFQEEREIRYYGRHEWVTEPTRMLQPAVVRALERSGGFAAVLSPPSSANADRRLDLELVALHQDFLSRRDSELVLIVRAQLVDLDARRVLGTRTFERREPAGPNPVSGAEAADRALARVLEELVRFAVDPD